MLLNFKNRAEAVPSGIFLAAILLLAGMLAYMLIVPMPKATAVAGRERSKLQLENDIEQAKARKADAQKAADARSWTGTQDSVMAVALARLTQQAAKSRLEIGAFRPQRPQAVAGMSELPFSLQLTGSYPTLLAFIDSLDDPANKLALRSLQIASGDAASSTVTVTAGLSAYLADGGKAAGILPAAGASRPRPTAAASSAPAAATTEGGTHG